MGEENTREGDRDAQQAAQALESVTDHVS